MPGYGVGVREVRGSNPGGTTHYCPPPISRKLSGLTLIYRFLFLFIRQPRDKLLLTLVWYSCMMSAGLVYIANNRLHHHNTTPIHMVPRHDNIPATPLSSIRRWTRGFTTKTPEPQSVITSSSSHVTELLTDRRNVTSGVPSVGVDSTTPMLIRELTGYVNVIDNKVSTCIMYKGMTFWR